MMKKASLEIGQRKGEGTSIIMDLSHFTLQIFALGDGLGAIQCLDAIIVAGQQAISSSNSDQRLAALRVCRCEFERLLEQCLGVAGIAKTALEVAAKTRECEAIPIQSWRLKGLA